MSYLSKSFSILPRGSSRPVLHPVKNHRIQAFRPTQVSSTSSTPFHKPVLLSQLKSRKKAEDFEITPIYAAQVVKKYLLPMFDKKKSQKSDISRKQMMGLASEGIPTLETTESSVLGELQLSDQLLRELESNLLVLNEAESKVKRCEQEKFEMTQEISRLAKENDDLRINLEGLIMQTTAGSRNTQTYEMIVYMLQKQLENFKKLYKANEFKLEQVSQMLSEERSTNDKYKAEIIGKDYLINLMAIENQILKDKLAGLSQSFESIIFKKSELEISLDFLSKIIQLASENDKKLWACEKKFIDMKILKEDLNYRLVKLTDAKNIIVFNQEKVLEQTKEKLAKSKEELVLALEEKERVKGRLENLQSSHQSLVEVYEKMRKRALQANSRSLANSTEKMCTNCKKVYFEEENFNWSCKVHTSPFSDFWWCCGKKDKNAPGCKICKHESRDDDIAQEEVINETKSFCSTCKKKGHKCKDCPLDPNAKTKPDMIEEADRLALISKEKSLKQGQKEELNQNHSSLHNKIQELISCSESETFEEADGFFPDLMSLKRNTLFDLEKTRHKIQTLTDESPFVLRKLKTQKKTRPQQGS